MYSLLEDILIDLRQVPPVTLSPESVGRLIAVAQKVDIRVIQMPLGHKRPETTSFYAAVATDPLRSVISPLDQTSDKVRFGEAWKVVLHTKSIA